MRCADLQPSAEAGQATDARRNDFGTCQHVNPAELAHSSQRLFPGLGEETLTPEPPTLPDNAWHRDVAKKIQHDHPNWLVTWGGCTHGNTSHFLCLMPCEAPSRSTVIRSA
jgi:hypothetical protein